MRASPAQSLTLSFFARPYLELESVREDDPRFTQPGRPGTALVWQLAWGMWSREFKVVRRRPPGMALIVILPTKVDLDAEPQVLRIVEACRPHSILPFHSEPHIDDLTALLGREPEHLAVEIMDYLDWRGITVTCPQMWYHFLC